MTVAAVVLFSSPDGAVADTAGRPAARRIAETAWAGGAVPIVVVAADSEDRVAASLAGSSAVLAEPAPLAGGAVAQIVRGMRVALEHVAGTEAALVWPGRLAWVDAETVTSLIEAHGRTEDAVLRPTYLGDPGWPVLIPHRHVPALALLGIARLPDELLADLESRGVPFRSVELGDPGVIHDSGTALDALPPFLGPPEPLGGPPPDWGPSAASGPEDAPLEGPALAPYTQVADADRE